ncbi:hypothetical protein IV72_GL000558 [Atopobium minutum]|uniref:Uncharacterized protein n=2 Tax=Atopobium minutum TaxID=1381 RepID=A0AB38A4V3_9ACTN|nr:hypothetical protein IV72_GL000558 [Atopobium minutum]SEB44085.1 hypothetical protein SAMN04489746_0231 [Atopobium minutum]
MSRGEIVVMRIRNAKTAEEYLLKCLFKAEDERDAAVAYCKQVREAEEERIAKRNKALENAPVFEVRDVETVEYEVENYYYLSPDYGLGDISVLEDALSLDDEQLYEWATKTYRSADGYYFVTPIQRTTETYNYILSVKNDDGVIEYVSNKECPWDFCICEQEKVTFYRLASIELDEQYKQLAIQVLRERLQKAIDTLSKDESGNGK